MTRYLTIRPDAHYSRSTATGPLLEYLRTFPELVANGQMSFRNATGFPWVSIVLAFADEAGNYAVDGEFRPTVNVVELVRGDGDEKSYEPLARRIASFLQWEAVEEHSDRRLCPSDLLTSSAPAPNPPNP